MRARVCKVWKQSYNPALKVVRGDQLLVLKADSGKWAGWLWCRDKTGLTGWLPEQIFVSTVLAEPCIVNADFDTVELTVRIGQAVEISQQLNGWSWCKADHVQAGWVPDECLQTALDAA